MTAIVDPGTQARRRALRRSATRDGAATASLHRRTDRTAQLTPQPARQVLFVTTEMTDFIKTGGLGDVAAALPRALSATQDMRVLIPAYPCVLAKARSLTWVGRTRAFAGLPETRIGQMETEDGLVVYVVHQPDLFEREGSSPYISPIGGDWSDNAIRFATLSYAAAQIAIGKAGMAWQPDVLHLNDWPTALAACYARWDGHDVPTVLTLHNLAYQGLFPVAMRHALGFPRQTPEAEFHGHLSFLRAGLIHADYITAVSGSYARQIIQPAHGMGLHLQLEKKAAQGRLVGILNGIDPSWNPAIDPALPAPFTVNQMASRTAIAAKVREEFGLREPRGPLFAFVARMVHQKGVDMVCDAAPQIVAAGGQLIMIGCGDISMERDVARLARRFPGQVGVHIGFDDGMARRMFAGSDFLLMPSRFEPCGLSQMYAQAYGSLPIAHATGGLIDTIEDGVTGLLFQHPHVAGLRHSLQRAFRIFEDPALLGAMRRAAMLEPHDWSGPASKYASLYALASPVRAAA
ncbi:glycogen synthase GlgA [Dyella sp.]|uniref:glycogen synthase GlgA n=1 Tax=Dyella sp. TaxID=1869338 RepID=UPI002ED405FB